MAAATGGAIFDGVRPHPLTRPRTTLTQPSPSLKCPLATHPRTRPPTQAQEAGNAVMTDQQLRDELQVGGFGSAGACPLDLQSLHHPNTRP